MSHFTRPSLIDSSATYVTHQISTIARLLGPWEHMLLPLFCREILLCHISHIPNEALPEPLSPIFSSLSPNCLHVIAKKQQVELPRRQMTPPLCVETHCRDDQALWSWLLFRRLFKAKNEVSQRLRRYAWLHSSILLCFSGIPQEKIQWRSWSVSLRQTSFKFSYTHLVTRLIFNTLLHITRSCHIIYSNASV